MLQEDKLIRISNFNESSFNGKGDSLNIKIKTTSKSLLIISKYLKFIILAEILIIFFAGYFLLINPKLVDLSNSYNLLKDKQDELHTLKSFQEQGENLKIAYETIEREKTLELEELKNILPQEKNLPELVAQVEALILSNGLVLSHLNINSTGALQSEQSKAGSKNTTNIKGGSIREIEISLTILGGDGTYEKVKQLLDSLENHIRLIDIRLFSFDEKMSSYSINFKTYYLKNE